MKDNKPEEFLMKRKRYGYGWIPVTWQGWLLILLQAAVVIIAATFLPAKPAHPTSGESLRYFIIVACAILTIVLVSIQSSPSPKWRWGKKPGDNPDEDF